MTIPAEIGASRAASAASKSAPVMLILFTASGCPALIYALVWSQLLQLAIGSSSVSLAILLAVFLGGLSIGGVWFPRLKPRSHPLCVYAALELGIGLLGIAALFEIPLLSRVYLAALGTGAPEMLLRELLAAICLLPPAVLMGACFPAIVGCGESREVSWWGLLYAGRIAGAAVGCLLAGFYLLRIYNVAVATFVAAAFNFVIGLAAYSISADQIWWATGRVDPGDGTISSTRSANGTVYVTIGLSGSCAFGAAILWTRLMGYLMGSTVYAFTIIIFVLAIGLAIGAALGCAALRVVRPRPALGAAQIAVCGAIAWSARTITDSLPNWPINPLLAANPWFLFQLDLARTLWTLLPPAILWGACFPLALAAAARFGSPSKIAGGIYATNTLGGIAGAISVSLILIPRLGTQQTQRLMLIVSAGGALLLLLPYIRQTKSAGGLALLAISLSIAIRLAWGIHATPGELIAYGRRAALNAGQSQISYSAEGRNSSVAISQWNGGGTYLNVNGHVEATTEIYDMKVQRMLGHLPALLHPNPKSVLGIGFGGGVTAGAFTRYPSIEHITVCEIEPVIPFISTRYFRPQNYGVMLNPKTRMVYDDPRHCVLSAREKFDIIASNPMDAFVIGAAMLRSKDYFEVVKQHLNPGGMFTLYTALYESDENTVRSELATFLEAFPYAAVWANTREGLGYDMVFLGQTEPLVINLEELQARWNRPDYAGAVESLRQVGFASIIDLLATYTGGNSDLGEWSKGAKINSDQDLSLQYMAGWGMNSQLEDYIYRQMLSYRKVPENLFTGSAELVGTVLSAVQADR